MPLATRSRKAVSNNGRHQQQILPSPLALVFYSTADLVGAAAVIDMDSPCQLDTNGSVWFSEGRPCSCTNGSSSRITQPVELFPNMHRRTVHNLVRETFTYMYKNMFSRSVTSSRPVNFTSSDTQEGHRIDNRGPACVKFYQNFKPSSSPAVDDKSLK